MNKRTSKQLRRDRLRREEHKRSDVVIGMYASSVYMRMTESELEEHVDQLPNDSVELAMLLLVEFCSGIALRDYKIAEGVALETAAGEGEPPALVALRLLAIRDLAPQARARALPDPHIRSSLAGFFRFPGTPISPYLSEIEHMTSVDDVMMGIKRLLCDREVLLAAQAGVGASGPGVVGCGHPFSHTETSERSA